MRFARAARTRPGAPAGNINGAGAADPDVSEGRGGLASALRHRNFAFMWSAALVSNTGSWIQHVTVPYVLYRLTGSAAWVGFAAFAQFLPLVLTGPLAGSLADRFPRRRILLLTQSLMALGAFGLWAIWVAGARSPVLIVALVSISGVVACLNIPAWQAFVTELVPRSVLLNAITLNSAQFNASRAFGPAVGGLVLLSLGPGWAFLINGLSYAAVLAALMLIRVKPIERPQAARPAILREFAATIRYTRSQPGIWTCLLVVVALGLFGSPLFSLLVVFTDDVFHVGEAGYGLLSACQGMGAIAGTPFLAGQGNAMRRGRVTGAVLIVYGVAVAAFGLSPAYWVGAVALAVAGGAYMALASALNTTLQLQVDESMRGKVIAFYLMGLTAAVPIGALAQGWLVETVGPRPTVAGAGFLLVVAALALRVTDRFAAMDGSGTDGISMGIGADDDGAGDAEAVRVEAPAPGGNGHGHGPRPERNSPSSLTSVMARAPDIAGEMGLAGSAPPEEVAPPAHGADAQHRLAEATPKLDDEGGTVDDSCH
ncbi:hypothetical protein BH18ACT4_BH18ACT4_07030 [soil metagenome]